MPELVRVSAPAKVNLRLRVLAREESGYHSLETIFLAVSLTDEISIEREAGGVEIEVSGGIDTGPPERNLVRLAAEAFRRRFRIKEGVSIRLHKRIPAAAGLGGGSSDAA